MPKWTFLTHHGHVLVAVVQNPDLTIDQIAAKDAHADEIY